ncbi:MAG: hypothetical protein ACR5LC_09125 [Symbiopectobacterium sp.]
MTEQKQIAPGYGLHQAVGAAHRGNPTRSKVPNGQVFNELITV